MPLGGRYPAVSAGCEVLVPGDSNKLISDFEQQSQSSIFPIQFLWQNPGFLDWKFQGLCLWDDC